MTPAELATVFARTLDDRRITRSEAKALREVIADLAPSSDERARMRNQAFAAAKNALTAPGSNAVLEWLDEVLKIIETPAAPALPSSLAECFFSPGSACLDRLLLLIEGARATLDVCVFTITDDRIARALVDAHHRGKKIRIITDDEKSFDLGSDVERFTGVGLEVRLDRSPAHMHHKFVLIDRALLATGSYNWTRSAADFNHENLLVSDDRRHVEPYNKVFDELWRELSPRT
jgi:mitochondrial cardiolipin hydrolase